MAETPLFEIRGLGKSFPGVRALDDFDIDIWPGEVHVLIGENGAGKSTLIKIIAGIYRRDAGMVRFAGRLVDFSQPREAIAQGVSVVHQELRLLPDLTVAENVFVGQETGVGRWGWVDRRRQREEAAKLVSQLDLSLPVDAIVGTLSTAQQQIVELVRALSRDVRCIIMDEPTASLSDREVSSLFRVIDRLKKQNVAIVYVSHRLHEIEQIGDRVSVMKDGRLVKTVMAQDAEQRELVAAMVGRDIDTLFPARQPQLGDVTLRVDKLTHEPYFRDVTFGLRSGEILGIAGLVGAGRTELLRSIFAADASDSGQVEVVGEPGSMRSPQEAIQRHLGLVPEDRRRQALLLAESLEKNISLPSLPAKSAYGFVARRWERNAALQYTRQLGIRTPSVATPIRVLSGGNQQKAILARWLAAQTRILLLDEPTRGIDVHSKFEIYRLLHDFVAEGGSVIVVSSDLPELLGIADRLLVMRSGNVAGQLDRQAATEERVMSLATLSNPMKP